MEIIDSKEIKKRGKKLEFDFSNFDITEMFYCSKYLAKLLDLKPYYMYKGERMEVAPNGTGVAMQ